MRRRREAIDQGLWRAGRTGVLVCGELGSGVPRGEKASLANEEAIGRQAQGDVVVQAAPGASLEVAEPDLLLELAVIPLDPPPSFSMAHQIGERRIGRQRDQPVAPVAGRLGVLDEQPLLRAEPAGRGAPAGTPEPTGAASRSPGTAAA